MKSLINSCIINGDCSERLRITHNEKENTISDISLMIPARHPPPLLYVFIVSLNGGYVSFCSI